MDAPLPKGKGFFGLEVKIFMDIPRILNILHYQSKQREVIELTRIEERENRKEILADLRRVAGRKGKLSRSTYRNRGNFASSTVESYFSGSFTKARKQAGLLATV